MTLVSTNVYEKLNGPTQFLMQGGLHHWFWPDQSNYLMLMVSAHLYFDENFQELL